MNINHLNLVVENVAETAHFFVTYFEFEQTIVKGENVIAVLRNKENFTLVLSTDKAGNNHYPKDFHIGFMLNSQAQVDRTYEKLKSGGIEPGRVPGKIRNSYAFYFHFATIFIEVGYYFDS